MMHCYLRLSAARKAAVCAALLLLVEPSLASPSWAEARDVYQRLAFDIFKELVEINTVTATGDTAHAAETMAVRLRSAGKRLVDTTCPLVERVHRAAQALQAEGYHVLVIGRRGHVEVQGIVEDLHSCDVIQSPEEVRRYPHERLGVVCQTTTPERTVRAVREAIGAHNPHAEVRFIDTVCHPTKDHQKALERLLGRAREKES